MKICIIVASLSVGGAEKSSAMLSEMLVDEGYSVVIVSEQDKIDYRFEGELINLGKKRYFGNDVIRRLSRIYYVYDVLKNRNFDYVIDTRSRRSWLKQLIVNMFVFDPANTVFMVHNYNLRLYFPSLRFLARFLYKDAYKLVGVSKAAVANFSNRYGFKQGVCIYNAFDDQYCNELANTIVAFPCDHYIMSYGRIVDESKNYSFLIRTYSKSKLPVLGVKLLILGDGPDKTKIQRLVQEYGIEEFVIFGGFTKNPFPYVKKAMFTTLTSNYEGFPMVLIESLALGTPVVSVDCKSGPSEIIETGKNGVLVNWNDESAYTKALDIMVSDQDFYNKCKKGTIPSVFKFRREHIISKWKEVLSEKV